MKIRGFITIVAVWLAVFAAIETAAWIGLKAWLSRHPSDNDLVNEYVRRGHPLFTDNSDLRTKELGYAFDPILGYVLQPNLRYPYLHLGKKAYLDADATGRIHNGDPERNTRLFALPGDKIYRVVLFGGSTMIGQNASDNAHTIPADLERLLTAQWPGVTFHVINAGVFGYQSTQERLSYEMTFRPMRPDLVIFLDGFNDAATSSTPPEWQPHNSNMSMTPEKYVAQFSPSKALAAWASNLLRFPEPLATLAWLRRGMARITPGISDAPTGAKMIRHYYPEAAPQLEENVSALAAEVRSAGGRAIFALQPFIGRKKPFLTAPEKALLDRIGTPDGEATVIGRYFSDFDAGWQRLERDNDDRVSFLDLTAAFEATTDHIYDDIVHYNDTGNKILAQRMLDAVKPGIIADLHRKGLAP